MNDLFETLGEAFKPENSLLSKSIDGYKKEAEKDELMKIAEKEMSRIIKPSSPHFKNYVLAYLLGFKDAGIAQTKKSISHMSSNFLE